MEKGGKKSRKQAGQAGGKQVKRRQEGQRWRGKGKSGGHRKEEEEENQRHWRQQNKRRKNRRGNRKKRKEDI